MTTVDTPTLRGELWRMLAASAIGSAVPIVLGLTTGMLRAPARLDAAEQQITTLTAAVTRLSTATDSAVAIQTKLLRLRCRDIVRQHNEEAADLLDCRVPPSQPRRFR